MTRLFVEPSAALPIISVLIAFGSGSVHDPMGREGLARLTARMLRRGAEGLKANEIEEQIDLLGGELVADVSPTATTVHIEFIRRSLDRFIDLAARVLATPNFDLDEFQRLQREAQAELIESRDSDRALASRAFRKTLFDGHPYGRRVSGTLASVAAITQGEVRGFYEKNYVRANAMVAISGDVRPGEAEAIAERLLARLPEGAAATDPVSEPTRRPGRRIVFVDKPQRTQTQMVIGGLGTHAHDPDHTPLLVANTVFGGTFTSRMMNEVRSKRGWSYGAGSRVGFDRHRDAFTMWTAPAATDAVACLQLEMQLLTDLRKDGVTQTELDFVKSYLIRSHAFEVDTARKRVHQKLDEELFRLPEGYYASYVDRVRAVELAPANEAVRVRLSEDDLVIGLVGTHSDIGEQIAKAIPNVVDVTVLPVDFE